MGWEEIIKDRRQKAIDSYETTKNRLEDRLKELTSHPQFNLEETLNKIDGSLHSPREVPYYDDFSKMVLKGEITFESGDNSPILNYVKENNPEVEFWADPTVGLMDMATYLLFRTDELYKQIIREIPTVRSVKFLQEVAETFGVNLMTPLRDIVRKKKAPFNYKGLLFTLHKGGVRISTPAGGPSIQICVVDEKKTSHRRFFRFNAWLDCC